VAELAVDIRGTAQLDFRLDSNVRYAGRTGGNRAAE
jgi:hypothetical protein